DLFRLITSANVAFGFHAGDAEVMRRTIRAATRANVVVGAHPSFRDREGFGRREIAATPQEIYDDVLEQVTVLAGIARTEGVALRHVKPHGALYNTGAKDRSRAHAIVSAIAAFDPKLLLIAPPASALVSAAVEQRLRVIAEGFADRSYQPDGSLIPRDVEGAVIHHPDAAARQAVRLA